LPPRRARTSPRVRLECTTALHAKAPFTNGNHRFRGAERGRECNFREYDPARDEYVFLQQDETLLDKPMRTFRMPGAGMESEMEQVTGATLVPGRFKGAMCYDARSQCMLLFGGAFTVGSGYRNDTWLWDGRDWTEAQSAVKPPAGYGAPVYDSRRGDIVMVVAAIGHPITTWRWTRANGWRQVHHVTIPPYIDFVAPQAAYDPVRDRVVALLQQRRPGFQTEITTWTFDGVDWRQESPANGSPVGRMLYSPELGGVVVIVNADHVPADPHQIWRWDGTDWTRVPVANRPGGERVPNPIGQIPRVFGGQCVYDSSRGKVRLFRSRGPGWFCEDLLVDRLSVNTTGPRIGGTWTATIRDASQAGNLFALAVSGSEWPALPVYWRPGLGAWRRLPLGDDWLFQASAAAGLGTGVLDANGIASFSLPIPNDPQLYGFRFHAAAV